MGDSDSRLELGFQRAIALRFRSAGVYCHRSGEQRDGDPESNIGRYYSPRPYGRNPALYIQTSPFEGMGEIALYLRVSTADQNLERQLSSTKQYAKQELDVEPGAWRIYDDKSTGTNVSRDGYQSLMADVEAGDTEHVVAHQVSRIARSISDLEQTADRLREHGCSLHVVQQGLEMRPGETNPYQRALFQLLGVFAELEAEIKRQNIREGIAARQASEEYTHGPAPMGFEKTNGRLVESADYHRVCTVLEEVARDELSQRQAAKELDCGRRTVRRAVNERADLYGL